MLVNPSVQQPSFTAQPTPAQSEVGREDVVRSDLPPVEQTSDSSAAQNQQLQNDSQRFAQDVQQQQAADDSIEQADESSRRSEESSQQQRLEEDRANEERAIQEQREQDEAIITQLKARDREVRVHEAAHAAVGGRYAGSPSLQYERGPDGVNYAVSGEVSISTSKASDPEVTFEKARIIRAAALAPAEPSAQDRRVAAEASQLEAEARTEIQQQKVESEQERKDRIERSRAEELKEDAANDDIEAAEEVEVESTEVAVASPQVGGESNRAANNNDEGAEQKSDESKTTAKDQLEEILLGSQSVPESLNQAGLVDTQNPYGKSGFIEYIV